MVPHPRSMFTPGTGTCGIHVQAGEAVLGASLSRSRFLICFALICSLFFLWGLSYGLLDSLNKHFQDLFHISKAQSTGLQGAYFGSYFVASIPASIFMNRFGYKAGIMMGLGLFAIGAIMFWPCAKDETYGGFLACTFVVASGLATLEVAANTFVCVIAGQKHASLALTLAQGFNGISAFAGPLIASKVFFTGDNITSFGSVQWTYLAIGCFGLFLLFLFLVVHFPEIKQDTTPEQEAYIRQNGYVGLFKRKRLVFGWIAETLYTGAQVAVASLAINFFVDTVHVSSAQAANLFSYCQMTFMAGRFLSVPILHYIHPPLMLGIYGTGCVLFSILVSQVKGNGAAVCLFFLFWCESICYPVIFSQATLGLGPYSKAGGAVIAMGVAGGAWYPSVQATLADARTTQLSYVVAAVGYISVAAYGYGLWIDSCRNNGFHVRVLNVEEDAALQPMTPDGKVHHHEAEKGTLDHYEESLGVNPLSLIDPPVAFAVQSPKRATD